MDKLSPENISPAPQAKVVYLHKANIGSKIYFGVHVVQTPGNSSRYLVETNSQPNCSTDFIEEIKTEPDEEDDPPVDSSRELVENTQTAKDYYVTQNYFLTDSIEIKADPDEEDEPALGICKHNVGVNTDDNVVQLSIRALEEEIAAKSRIISKLTTQEYRLKAKLAKLLKENQNLNSDVISDDN